MLDVWKFFKVPNSNKRSAICRRGSWAKTMTTFELIRYLKLNILNSMRNTRKTRLQRLKGWPAVLVALLL